MIERFIKDTTFIIGEAGVNHNGSLDMAKKLVDVAVVAGCNAVKFQTFKADNLVSKSAKKAKYQIENTGESESQYEMIKRLELTKEFHIDLINYCKSKNIMFLSTPFDEECADLLDELGVEVFKIPSGEITNLPFLRYVANKGKPIILSTGMSYLGEVEEAVNEIKKIKDVEIILLHCTSNYPADFEDVNLNAMKTIKNAFNLQVGYSDHTKGIEVSIAAVAMGAKVIEKHFTLDRELDGPDHKASLIPEELKSLVLSIRNIEKAFGNGIKKPAESETDTKEVARKSIIAGVKIQKGTVLSPEMLRIKRPGKGISPKYIEEIIGFECKEDIEEEQYLEWKHLK